MSNSRNVFAVYLCGATDCFLAAVFNDNEEALEYGQKHSRNPEGFYVREWKRRSDVDFTDTGFDFKG